MKAIWFKRIAAALALLSLTTAASAQYVWLDDKGVKQFSDMPPPAVTPKNRILKDPGTALRSAPQATTGDAPDKPENSANGASAPNKAQLPMTTAEKNADFQKRRIEQAEKEKKDAEKAKLEADKTQNCELARAYNRNLESGVRLGGTDKNGERYILNDEQRAQESRDNKRILDACK